MKIGNVFLSLLICWLVAGCGNSWDSMTNEEVVAQVEICKEAGLEHSILVNGISNNVFKVNCMDGN